MSLCGLIEKGIAEMITKGIRHFTKHISGAYRRDCDVGSGVSFSWSINYASSEPETQSTTKQTEQSQPPH